MSTHTDLPQVSPTPDLTAIKSRQQATWSSGDYSAVGISLQFVSESLCEAVDLRSGSRVLDVATGNGNTALAAARRHADVVAVDYVPSLLERGRQRSAAERLPVDFQAGDCEALPFGDAAFDCVLSTFGCMFAPDHVRTARELARVCKPHGKIGLANWTPESIVGQMFATLRPFAPPPPGLSSPLAWGTESHLKRIFGANAASIRVERKEYVFRFRSPEHWLDVFGKSYGPVLKALESLEPVRRNELSRALLADMQRANRSGDGTLVVPSEYLEVVVQRA
jgi:ubiquinone/menaquinone biosynthesis C-methylase UbiE